MKAFLFQYSFLYTFVRERINIFTKKYKTELLHIGLLPEEAPMVGNYSQVTINTFKIGYDGPDSQRIHKGWENTLKYLNKIYLMLKKHNIYLLVVFTPNDIQLEDDSLTAPQLVVGQFCGKRDIDFIDLIPCYKNAAYKKLFCDIGHPSVEGHEVIAKAILEKIYKRLDPLTTKNDK